LFDVGVPAANGIGDYNDSEPDEVGDRKAVAEAGRELLQWRAESGRREKKVRMPAVVDGVDGDVENMRQANVKEKIEKGDTPKNDDRIAGREIEFLQVSQRNERRTERHEKEEERWRIFCGVQERKKREEGGFLVRPGGRVAVMIEQAKKNEQND